MLVRRCRIRKIGKGGQTYQGWRQGWIARDMKKPIARECLVPGEPEMRKCGRCISQGRCPPVDHIDCEDGHYTTRNKRLALCHRKGRYSHPDKKMSDQDVFWACHPCNMEMSGAKFKEGKPQWTG
jgi:hypothetical protein